MRIGSYLRTMGKIKVLDSDLEDVEIALDTYVEVNIISLEFIR